MESECGLSRLMLDRPSSSQSTYGVPVSLNLNRKVFLSHSGKDKDFVWFLHKQLCRRYHDTIAFFDIETLPKATPVSMENILKEARGSKLGVLVLTEDFFMQTPNPMRELEAFVASGVQLLPLFFKMSVDQFKDKSRRAKWEKQWKKWFAKQLGGKSNVEGMMKRWKQALDIVNTFSGLECCKVANNQPEYIDKIVKEVTRIIPPTISYSGEGVYGKDRLCQIVDDMYKECVSKRLSVSCTTHIAPTYGLREGRCSRMLDVVGIHGFSGLGKTTLCRCLCDFYFAKLNGRVCYIDLGSLPSEQGSHMDSFSAFVARMQHMLSMLTDYNNDVLYFLDINQLKMLLREQLSSLTDPIFLAIDFNVLRSDLELEAREETDFYLSCEFPEDSKIFITSRSWNILEILTSQYSNISVVIAYMPALEFEEARDIFVHEIPKLRYFEVSNIEGEVNKCVEMCTCILKKGDMECYHPLMLKSMAAAVRWDRDWKGRLARMGSEGIVDKNDAFKKVFTMLDFTFAILTKEAQKMFLDLSLFYSTTLHRYKTRAWVESLYSHLHSETINKIFLQLEDLCFLDKHSWESPNLLVPNLLVDFCRYKVRQGDYAQSYEVVEAGAHWRDEIPRTARYISISGCGYTSYGRAQTDLDLRGMEAMEVLHLADNIDAGVQRVLLSSTVHTHLRSLVVRVPPGSSIRLVVDENWPSSAAGGHQGPQRMLYWLDLKGNVYLESLRRFERIRSWLSSNVVVSQALQHLAITAASVVMDLGSSVLGELPNLKFLTLSDLPSVQSVDVTTMGNLKHLDLNNLPGLKFVGGLDKSASIKHVGMNKCKQLSMLTITANSSYNIQNCAALKRVSFCTTSSYAGVLHEVVDLGSESPVLQSTMEIDLTNVKCLIWVLDQAGAESSVTSSVRDHSLRIYRCPAVRNVAGLLQYTGLFSSGWGFLGKKSEYLQETFGDLLKSVAIDSSVCKARVEDLQLTGHPPGLGGARSIHLRDALQIGLFTSALFKAQSKHLVSLSIHCQEGGDCGCVNNLPQFGPWSHVPARDSDYPQIEYCCPQVRDLASLAQWDVLRSLDLRGCTRVEVWPDFATMINLRFLDLSFTSLKEWPASVLLLRNLRHFYVMGCRQIAAEELVKLSTHEMQPIPGHFVCCVGSLGSLLSDLRMGRRDSCLVVDALDSHYQNLVAFFHRASRSATCSSEVVPILELMYDLWFEEGEACCVSEHTRTKMRRLLCAESFLSLPFHSWITEDTAVPKWPRSYCFGKSIGWRSYWDWGQEKLEGEVGVYCGLLGVALIGAASIGWCNAAVNDEYLKDRIIPFLRWFIHESVFCAMMCSDKQNWNWGCWLKMRQEALLRKRVGEGVCRMARVESVAAAMGEDFMHTTIQGLEVWVRDFSLPEFFSEWAQQRGIETPFSEWGMSKSLSC